MRSLTQHNMCRIIHLPPTSPPSCKAVPERNLELKYECVRRDELLGETSYASLQSVVQHLPMDRPKKKF